MSSGGDNHFVSARERDLRPLLEEGVSALSLDANRVATLEVFLGEAWLSGNRNGHAKMMQQALREREGGAQLETATPLDPEQLETIEAELRAIMETAAGALALPGDLTAKLWDLLSRAWTAGVHTYESEVVASLIERNSDIAREAQDWLENGGRDGEGRGPGEKPS